LGAEEDAKAGKKRHKWHHQEATIDDDDSINERASGSSAEHAIEATCNIKCQAQPPMDHFVKLLKETCLNHTYSIKHKLRDCGLMNSFMTTGSLPWGMEIDEAPTEGDATPFPREAMAMRIFSEHPSLEKHRTLDLGTGTPAHSSQRWGTRKCKPQIFFVH
jgi:hypothetical protein